MWKLIVGFVAFAALALYLMTKGEAVDMSGEKHGDMSHVEAPAAPASAPASVPPAAAPAAPASAASATQ